MASTWSQGQWNLGTWNNAVSGAAISGIQINASAGSFTFNLGNGAVFTPTGLSAGIDVNLGNGWSREEWNTGAWNQPIGSIVAGSGTIFIEDGQALTSLLNNSTVTASAVIDIVTSNGSTFSAKATTALSTDQAKFGTASVEFDGTSNQGVQQDGASGFGQTDFTSEFFVYSSTIESQTSCLWDFRNAGYDGLNLTNNNGQLSFFKNGAGGSSPAGVLSNNTWHHIAIVRTGSTGNVYVDGTLQITRDIGTTDYQTRKVLLGNDIANSQRFVGYIDELRNSDTVRYSSNFTPPSSAFTADSNTFDLLHFDGSDGSTIFTNSQTRLNTPVSANLELGEEIATAGSSNVITGEELVTAQIDSFAVAAGGSITINTPTFEANVEVTNSLVVGTANFIDITGTDLTLNLGELTLVTNNIISITGQELTITANNITIVAEHFQPIVGQALDISQATIIPKSENFLSITGNQANTDVSTLKFWDPILPTNTETWTNIH